MLMHARINGRVLTYDKTKSSSSLGVDEEQCWDGSNDLNSTVSKRSIQGLNSGVASISEDGGAVERND